MADPLLILLGMGSTFAATQMSWAGVKAWKRRIFHRTLCEGLADYLSLEPGPRRTAGVKGDLALYVAQGPPLDTWEGQLHLFNLNLRSLKTPLFSERIAFYRKPALDNNERRFHSGDPIFDAAVIARGPEHILRAILNSSTRGLIRQLVLRGHVKDAEIFRTVKVGLLPPSIEEAHQDAEDMFTLAEALNVSDKHVADRILQNAQEDMDAGVRARCLATFAALYRTREDLPTVLSRALEDSSPRVQIEAALRMRPVPIERLEAWIDDRHAPPEIRCRALKGLYTRAKKDHAVPRLMAALRDFTLRATAVRGLGAIEHTDALEAVCRAAKDEQVEVQEAAAGALGRLHTVRAEPMLIELLFAPVDSVRTAAAKSLGQVGSMRALPPLEKCLARLPLDHPLKSVIRLSIARIKHRKDTSTLLLQGGLSLVEDDNDGQLSFADAAGALSEPEPPEDP